MSTIRLIGLVIGFLLAPGVAIGQPVDLHPMPGEEEVSQMKEEKGIKGEDFKKEKKIFIDYEQPASFPGGPEAIKKFIAENMHYPQECLDSGIEGRVILKMRISETGEVGDIKVLKSVHPLLDAEAIRIASEMPDWEPGRYAGKPLATWFNIPITFRLPHGN